MSEMSGEMRLLRDLVERRLYQRWSDFAATHPHLAEVIDRTRLIDATAQRVRADAEFQSAMREAGLDMTTLAAAQRAIERAEAVAWRVLPL